MVTKGRKSKVGSPGTRATETLVYVECVPVLRYGDHSNIFYNQFTYKHYLKPYLTGGPGSPESPFLPFLPRLPGGPGGPATVTRHIQYIVSKVCQKDKVTVKYFYQRYVSLLF